MLRKSGTFREKEDVESKNTHPLMRKLTERNSPNKMGTLKDDDDILSEGAISKSKQSFVNATQEPSKGVDGSYDSDEKKYEMFNFDDLESLQDDNIDSNLLENHYLHLSNNEDELRKRMFTKHAQIYGYVVIP